MYASSAVHSALLVGLLRAKMTGVSLFRAISFNISVVKAPRIAAAPMMTDGLAVLTTSSKVSIGLSSRAKCNLCSVNPPFGRSVTSSPFESTIQILLLASSSVTPSFFIAITHNAAIPNDAYKQITIINHIYHSFWFFLYWLKCFDAPLQLPETRSCSPKVSFVWREATPITRRRRRRRFLECHHWRYNSRRDTFGVIWMH